MTPKSPHPARTRTEPARTALIQAGYELMSEQGADGFSLRQCAARAGVSHAAPAHHFGGMAGLKRAIVAEGFRRFSIHLHEDLKRAGPDPLDRLKSICRTYLRFALRRPALFKEMFALNALEIEEGKADDYVVRAWDLFRAHCAPFERPGLPLDIIELRVRAFLHGYTRIALTGQFGTAIDGKIPEGPLEQVMAMLDHLAQD